MFLSSMDDGLRRNTSVLIDHTWPLLALTVALTMAPAQIHALLWMFIVSSMVYLMSPKGLELAVTEKWQSAHHPQLTFCSHGAVTHTTRASCCCMLQWSPILTHRKETGYPPHLYFYHLCSNDGVKPSKCQEGGSGCPIRNSLQKTYFWNLAS